MNDENESETAGEGDVELVRFLFVLPEPVALPHGMQFSGPAGLGTPEGVQPDDPVVGLTFYQAEGSGGRMEAAFTALSRVMAEAPALDPPPSDKNRDKDWRLSTGIQVPFTVVDAVTVRESPDSIPHQDAHDPSRWTHRMDAFTRCVAAADWVLRAHRQATEALHGPLAYVRLISPVMAYQAPGVRERVDVDGATHLVHRPTGPWSGPTLMMLEHTNLADPFAPVEWDEEVAERFDHWVREHARENPLNLWRERYIGARRALYVTGDLSNGVLLANTSCESLFDTVIALLMWEEGREPQEAAGQFEDGKTLRRLAAELAPRLGGNWSTESGPVGDWYRRAYVQRHRIVHGGFAPDAATAQDALHASTGIHAFMWERLAATRNKFPRSAMMTLGREGLERRGLWAGQIKRFAEHVAPTESSWRNSFTLFHRDLVAARLAND